MVLHRDLEELEVKTIEQSSAASVTTNRYRSCLDAAKFIKPDLFSRISADKLRLQFREFMLRLGQLAPTLNTKENTEILGMILNLNCYDLLLFQRSPVLYTKRLSRHDQRSQAKPRMAGTVNGVKRKHEVGRNSMHTVKCIL